MVFFNAVFNSQQTFNITFCAFFSHIYLCSCFKIHLIFSMLNFIWNSLNNMLSRIWFLLLFVVIIKSVEIDFDFKEKVTEGEQHYNELVKKAESYGDCWKKAMSDLQSGCKRLTEDIQSRLALSFSNCFLKHAGLDSSPCSRDVPVSSCLRNSTDRVFSTYTEFFTHTQSICHYLLHREWQEEASKTVLMLTENSEAVSRKLDESFKSQSQILELQHDALIKQEKIISSSQVLNTELQKSRENARHVYDEFKMTTNEQRLVLFEVFDRIKNLQNFVLGEFTGVYTAGYYLITASLIYVLTSMPRTAEARIWLILVISLNAALERIITAYSLQEVALRVNPLDANELVYCRIWLSRRIACCFCFVILSVFYYHYKDYNVINNQLLREIQQQNLEIQMYIKGLNFHENFQNSSSSSHFSSVVFDTTRKEKLVLKTDVARSEQVLNELKKSISQQISVEKENNHAELNSSNNVTAFLKKTSRKKKVSCNVKSQDNTPKTTFLGESILSDLESPISPRRYNLRSSSRMNSPQFLP